MMTPDRTFDGELSTQQSLASHLLKRAIDSVETDDTDSFDYASEIYGETQERIQDLKDMQAYTEAVFAEHEPDMSLRPITHVIGTLAIGGAVLENTLRVQLTT
jgi:hypothetical protein